jgi:hypothetical protein
LTPARYSTKKSKADSISICAVKTRQQVSDENIWTPWNGGYSTPELQKLQRDDTDIGPILFHTSNTSGTVSLWFSFYQDVLT